MIQNLVEAVASYHLVYDAFFMQQKTGGLSSGR